MKKDNLARLRERVIIEQPAYTEDGEGGWTVEWTELAEVWAEVLALQGEESGQDFQMRVRQPYAVTVRFRDDINSAMRLRWRGKVLEIKTAVDEDGARKTLRLLCEGGF